MASATRVLEDLDLRGILRDIDSNAQEATMTVNPTSEAPLTFTLRGLAYFRSPAKCTTVYIQPLDASGRLPAFAGAVRQRFVDAGLLLEPVKALKLHATVISTVYSPKEKRGRLKTLDVREMIQKTQERIFVEEAKVEGVAMCKMGAKDADGVKGKGGYEVVAWKEL